MKKENKQIFVEVLTDHTDEETGNIALDAYPDANPDSENGRTVAWVSPDGEVILGTNPENKSSEVECRLVKEAIEEVKSIQAELKQKLVDDVIEDLKESFASGDYTVLDELLKFIPTRNLVQALPEEKWSDYQIKIK